MAPSLSAVLAEAAHREGRGRNCPCPCHARPQDLAVCPTCGDGHDDEDDSIEAEAPPPPPPGQIAFPGFPLPPGFAPPAVSPPVVVGPTGRVLKLFDFQVQGVAWLRDRDSALLADDQGLGKTPQAIYWGAERRPVLVVVPAVVLYNWDTEIREKWRPSDTVTVLESDASLPERLTDWTLVTYDQVRRRLPSLQGAGFAAIVIDEAHKIKNLRTARTRSVLDLVAPLKPVPGHRSIPARLAVSGTPMVNRPAELFSILVFLGKEARTEGAYRAFLGRYTEYEETPGGERFTAAKNLDELHARIRPFTLRRLKRDVLTQLPPKTHRPIFTTLSNRDDYAEAERDFLTWLEKNRGEAAASRAAFSLRAQILVQLNYLRQLAAVGKVAAVGDFLRPCQETGHKATVFSTFVETLETLQERRGGSIITGAVPPRERAAIVKDFQTNPSTCFLFGTYGAAGVGITLTAADRCVEVDLPWTPGEKAQAEDRIHRIGQTKGVEIIPFIARGTIDEHIMRLLSEKEQVIARVIDGLDAGRAASESVATRLINEYLRLAQAHEPPAVLGLPAYISEEEAETLEGPRNIWEDDEEDEHRVDVRQDKITIPSAPDPWGSRCRDVIGRWTETAECGPFPTDGRPQASDRTFAIGVDGSTRYELRNVLVEADKVLASHDPHTFELNPRFPPELHPRLRGRAATRLQVERMAKGLNPVALLTDFHTLDRGAPIVGPDMVVESGNGRVMALQLAAQDVPDSYQRYRAYLSAHAEEFGLRREAVDKMATPILVRVRLSDVDRVAFSREGNASAAISVSSIEKARVDAESITAAVLEGFEVGEGQSIEEAIRAPGNRLFVVGFLGRPPENERAALVDAQGVLNMDGTRRIALALFLATFPGTIGLRIAERAFESSDLEVRNVTNGVSRALGALAHAETLIRDGERDDDLSIGEDLARAINTLSVIKKSPGMTVERYLQQGQFVRELTPFQERVLQDLAARARSAKRVGALLNAYGRRVVELPPKSQAGLFGPGAISKEEVWALALRDAEREDMPLAAQGDDLYDFTPLPPLMISQSEEGPTAQGGIIPPEFLSLKVETRMDPATRRPEGPTILRPEDLQQFFTRMRHADREWVLAIFTNTPGHVVGLMQTNIGIVDSSLVDSHAILRAAILGGATGVFLAHNHPGGSTTPSPSDTSTWNELRASFKELRIKLHDMVVVGLDGDFTIAGNRLLPVPPSPSSRVEREAEEVVRRIPPPAAPARLQPARLQPALFQRPSMARADWQDRVDWCNTSDQERGIILGYPMFADLLWGSLYWRGKVQVCRAGLTGREFQITVRTDNMTREVAEHFEKSAARLLGRFGTRVRTNERFVLVWSIAFPDEQGRPLEWKPQAVEVTPRGEPGDQARLFQNFRTVSGRIISGPIQRGRVTDRGVRANIYSVDVWLVEQAKAEAAARNDQWNLDQFARIDPKKITIAERDGLNLYLFGQEEVPLPVPQRALFQKGPLPWQERAQDYSDLEADVFGEPRRPVTERFREWHKAKVRDALYEGKPVPAKVLDEYPDLAALYPQPALLQARGSKRLLPAEAISDFRPGVDVVIRKDGRTYVHDREGSYADQEVQSDAMPPEFVERFRALSSEHRARMLDAIRHTPYLTEEGRLERLRALEDAGLAVPSFQVFQGGPMTTLHQDPTIAELGRAYWARLHQQAEEFRQAVKATGTGCGCGDMAVAAAQALHDAVNAQLGKPIQHPEALAGMARFYEDATARMEAPNREPTEWERRFGDGWELRSVIRVGDRLIVAERGNVPALPLHYAYYFDVTGKQLFRAEVGMGEYTLVKVWPKPSQVMGFDGRPINMETASGLAVRSELSFNFGHDGHFVKPAPDYTEKLDEGTHSEQAARAQGGSRVRLSSDFLNFLVNGAAQAIGATLGATAAARALGIGATVVTSPEATIRVVDREKEEREKKEKQEREGQAGVFSPSVVPGDAATVDVGSLLEELNVILRDPARLGEVDPATLQVVRAAP